MPTRRKRSVLRSRPALLHHVSPAMMDVLEPRLLMSGTQPLTALGEALDFQGDTSAYVETTLGDATPTGTSFMLHDEWGGTWADVEKSPTNYDDDLMCWAAAASNILDWTGWGEVQGMTTADDMFQYFCEHWTDNGGLMEFGWDWWFDGTNDAQGWNGWSQEDVQGGGFYPDLTFSDYYHYDSEDSRALETIETYLRSGYGTTLGIYGPGGHAITVWGFNYDETTGDYLGLWVTDSDDYKYTDNPPDKLRYYEVQQQNNRWYLQDYYGSDSWYIGVISALEQMPSLDPVPEIDVEAGAEQDVHAFDFGNVEPDGSVSQTFTIRNEGTAPLVISQLVPPSSDAFTLDVVNGAGSGDDWTLAAGGTFTFQVTFSPGEFGQFQDTLTLLSNDGDESSWALSLSGRSADMSVIYSADMSTDPGWVLEGDWEYGTPAGQGGQYGPSDPEFSKSGENFIVGYNLDGDYAPNIVGTHYATTGAIDCSNYHNVTLTFQRWLGVEQPAYDHANLQVSTGGGWTTIWANTGEVADDGWVEVTYDLSALADQQARVFLRWGMGSTDSIWQYCGWNIDDVVLTGEHRGDTVTVQGTAGDDIVVIEMGQPDGSHAVTINGATTYYDANTVTSIELDAGGGNDVVTVYGTDSNDAVSVFASGTGSYSGGTFKLSLAGSESMVLHSGGGMASIRMTASAADDSLTVDSTEALLLGNGFQARALGFSSVWADLGEGNDTVDLDGRDGQDLAYLLPMRGCMFGSGYDISYRNAEQVTVQAQGSQDDGDRVYSFDSAGDDLFVYDAGRTYMYGDGYQNLSQGFQHHFAYASSGYDRAYFYEADGNDRLISDAGTIYLYGSGTQAVGRGFTRVWADLGGGEDSVFLYGQSGRDIAQVLHNRGRMAGNGYDVTYRNVENAYVHALGSQQDRDTMYSYDSEGDDQFLYGSGLSYMYGSNYMNRSRGFEHHFVYGSEGTDQCDVYGTAGQDRLISDAGNIYFDNSAATVCVRGFDSAWVNLSGGADAVYLYGQTGQDIAEISPYHGSMVGSGYDVTYRNAESVYTQALGSDQDGDRILFYDSAGDDQFFYDCGQATMQGNGYMNRSRGFQEHAAYGSTGYDRAYMYGENGTTSFYRSGTLATLSSSLGTASSDRFDVVYAYSRSQDSHYYDSGGQVVVQRIGTWQVHQPQTVDYMVTDQYGGSWSDAEKSPANSQDDLMCWAAAASNILEWTGWGNVNGMTTTDQMFAYFQDHWTDEGGLMYYGWDWWFDGTNDSQGFSGWSQVDVAGGGFFQQETFSQYFRRSSNTQNAARTIRDWLQEGYGVSLGVYGPGGHAITVWGVRYDTGNPNNILGIYVTDSDDGKSSTNPSDQLQYYELEFSNNQWYLQNFYGSNSWYIGLVEGLARRGAVQSPTSQSPDALQTASEFALQSIAVSSRSVDATRPLTDVDIEPAALSQATKILVHADATVEGAMRMSEGSSTISAVTNSRASTHDSGLHGSLNRGSGTAGDLDSPLDKAWSSLRTRNLLRTNMS